MIVEPPPSLAFPDELDELRPAADVLEPRQIQPALALGHSLLNRAGTASLDMLHLRMSTLASTTGKLEHG